MFPPLKNRFFHLLGSKIDFLSDFEGIWAPETIKKPKNRIYLEKVRKLTGEWSGMLFISILDRLEPIPTHPPHFFDFFSKNPIFDPLGVIFGHMGNYTLAISPKI